MEQTLSPDIAVLQRMTTSDLRRRYAEVFGEQPSTWNRIWMFKRLAWRLQALAEGGLSERARRRAAALVQEADLRLSAPPAGLAPSDPPALIRWPADARLPRPGTILTRRYKGRTLTVEVLEHGFAYEGQIYRSLSDVAKAVTGSHCSGHFFFGLTTKGQDQ